LWQAKAEREGTAKTKAERCTGIRMDPRVLGVRKMWMLPWSNLDSSKKIQFSKEMDAEF